MKHPLICVVEKLSRFAETKQQKTFSIDFDKKYFLSWEVFALWGEKIGHLVWKSFYKQSVFLITVSGIRNHRVVIFGAKLKEWFAEKSLHPKTRRTYISEGHEWLRILKNSKIYFQIKMNTSMLKRVLSARLTTSILLSKFFLIWEYSWSHSHYNKDGKTKIINRLQTWVYDLKMQTV